MAHNIARSMCMGVHCEVSLRPSHILHATRHLLSDKLFPPHPLPPLPPPGQSGYLPLSLLAIITHTHGCHMEMHHVLATSLQISATLPYLPPHGASLEHRQCTLQSMPPPQPSAGRQQPALATRDTGTSTAGAQPREIVFTSGATESNNLALKGVANFYKDSKRHIITTQTEHKCVLDSCRVLQQQGFEVTYLAVDSEGLIDLDALRAAIRPDTVMVSAMFINNEIGVIQPVEEIGAICREHKVRWPPRPPLTVSPPWQSFVPCSNMRGRLRCVPCGLIHMSPALHPTSAELLPAGSRRHPIRRCRKRSSLPEVCPLFPLETRIAAGRCCSARVRVPNKEKHASTAAAAATAAAEAAAATAPPVECGCDETHSRRHTRFTGHPQRPPCRPPSEAPCVLSSGPGPVQPSLSRAGGYPASHERTRRR